MLYQLHWQYRGTDKTEMKAQRDVDSTDDMRQFIKETQGAFPLPGEANWMACNEKSPYFVFAKAEKSLFRRYLLFKRF